MKGDERGGGGSVSFDGAPLQHLHIFKSGDECHAWGWTKTSQWEGCVSAAGSEAAVGIPAAPWEKHGEVVWEPRGPPIWAEGGEPLVVCGEFAFYLCPFSSVISAPALQPQMANTGRRICICVKDDNDGHVFHPDRDIPSLGLNYILMSRKIYKIFKKLLFPFVCDQCQM